MQFVLVFPNDSFLFAWHDFFFHLCLVQVKSLVFDQSGTYLAVGGSDIRVYICKQWSEVLNFTGEGIKSNCIFGLLSIINDFHLILFFTFTFLDHTGLVTGVAFGDNARFLSSAGMDRSLKFYSL